MNTNIIPTENGQAYLIISKEGEVLAFAFNMEIAKKKQINIENGN